MLAPLNRSPVTRSHCFWPTWANGDFDHTSVQLVITSSVWFLVVRSAIMSTTSLLNLEEIHPKELEIQYHHSDFLVTLIQTCIACLLDQLCAFGFFPDPRGTIWPLWGLEDYRHLGFVTSLPAAIWDLWRHFRPPSWIYGHMTSCYFVVTWLPVRKSCDWKSKMAAGSNVTNPRWHPAVMSQIQAGGNPLILLPPSVERGYNKPRGIRIL